MKVTSITEYKMDFAMKDGKKVHSFKVSAKSETEARAMLTSDMGEILDQLETEDKKEALASEKKKPAPQVEPGE